jgi:hypothetical protein
MHERESVRKNSIADVENLLTPNIFLWVVASNMSLSRKGRLRGRGRSIIVPPFVSSDQMIREVLFGAE